MMGCPLPCHTQWQLANDVHGVSFGVRPHVRLDMHLPEVTGCAPLSCLDISGSSHEREHLWPS